MSEQRRSTDPLVSKLAFDVEKLQGEMQRNTEVTEQVRDILTSFKTAAAIAKWISTIAACGAALIAFLKGVDIRR